MVPCSGESGDSVIYGQGVTCVDASVHQATSQPQHGVGSNGQ